MDEIPPSPKLSEVGTEGFRGIGLSKVEKLLRFTDGTGWIENVSGELNPIALTRAFIRFENVLSLGYFLVCWYSFVIVFWICCCYYSRS